MGARVEMAIHAASMMVPASHGATLIRRITGATVELRKKISKWYIASNGYYFDIQSITLLSDFQIRTRLCQSCLVASFPGSPLHPQSCTHIVVYHSICQYLSCHIIGWHSRSTTSIHMYTCHSICEICCYAHHN